MKKLELVFKASDNKVKILSLNYASEDLSGQAVKEQMDIIAGLKMFDRNGVNPYAQPLAARYSQNFVEPLFDNRKK
ncbi:DUF2922 domain-containing protein [Lentilactobacillus sp. Marseille-Q4993]|uniref:DUF2922 domain-containing protein n=1 Tax=Lentilactobacillus sp. Marseille-Q4993 TaxID=3039492 RepID=UPI0024BC6E71|nr:DUF2922 domain-containing protein [Lentilactobacillus sp. Marseille-Q4993]